MSRAAAALALAPSLSDRGETLTAQPPAPSWATLRSVPAAPEAAASTPIWEATTQGARTARLPGLSADRERAIIEAIVRPIDPNDGHRVGNDRKEDAVRALFAALPVLEALELQRRLRVGRADDAVAAAFGRMVVDRRQRLLAFLGDARRRDALARG